MPDHQAFILAAGKGSRLGELTQSRPKPMLVVDGKPILQHNLELCRRSGITHVVINLHHEPDEITSYFGNGSRFGLDIKYSYEKELMGTSGGLRFARGLFSPGPLFVFYGDNLIDYDLTKMTQWQSSTDTQMVIALFASRELAQSGVATMDKNGFLTAFLEKPGEKMKGQQGFVNAGLYFLKEEIIDLIPDGVSDFGRDVIPSIIEKGVGVRGLVYDHPVRAVDTPALFEHQKSSKPSPAVFLDRDGILNEVLLKENLPYPPKTENDLKVFPEIKKYLQMLKERGFKLIVVTNQPDVGRGTTPKSTVEKINERLRTELPIDDVRVCYDDADVLRKKPAPGMILEAAKIWNIDLHQSYAIGDRWKDVEAGRQAGCKTVFVDFHYSEKSPESSDQVVSNPVEGLRWIIDDIEN